MSPAHLHTTQPPPPPALLALPATLPALYNDSLTFYDSIMFCFYFFISAGSSDRAVRGLGAGSNVLGRL